MIHDLAPGPLLFTERPDLVYGLFASMFVANGVMFLLGLWGSRLWIKVTKVPLNVLIPLIISIASVGSFAVKNSLFDVGACFGFGALGWVLKRYGYPMAPIVLGMVLGKLMEVNFRRAVIMGGYEVFFHRPASLILLLISLAAFAYPLLQSRKGSNRKGAEGN
jgi:putative tricarboxylic transport membrane protein